MDNLEAAPGRPAPESKVKTLKMVKFSDELIFSSRKIIKIISLLLKPIGGKLESTWRPLEADPGGQPGTDTLICLHVCLIVGFLG